MNSPIKRNDYETDASYNRRVWFIRQISPKNKIDKEEAVKLSNIWVNTILLHCIYPKEVMIKIAKIIGSSIYTNKDNNRNKNKNRNSNSK